MMHKLVNGKKIFFFVIITLSLVSMQAKFAHTQPSAELSDKTPIIFVPLVMNAIPEAAYNPLGVLLDMLDSRNFNDSSIAGVDPFSLYVMKVPNNDPQAMERIRPDFIF